MSGRGKQPTCKIRKFVLSFFAILDILANTNSTAQNFWKQTNGPYGGYIQSLAINAKEHIFAGTIGGGIFRSINNGASWTAVNIGLPKTDRLSVVTQVGAIIFDASGNIYAGMSPGGVFRSQNNGASWMPINNGLENPQVSSLAISPNGDIFAGIFGGGVFRSTNNGNNWMPVNNGLTYWHIVALAINSEGHVFAGTSSLGVYCSTNNGESWTQTSLDDADVLSGNQRTWGYFCRNTLCRNFPLSGQRQYVEESRFGLAPKRYSTSIF